MGRSIKSVSYRKSMEAALRNHAKDAQELRWMGIEFSLFFEVPNNKISRPPENKVEENGDDT